MRWRFVQFGTLVVPNYRPGFTDTYLEYLIQNKWKGIWILIGQVGKSWESIQLIFSVWFQLENSWKYSILVLWKVKLFKKSVLWSLRFHLTASMIKSYYETIGINQKSYEVHKRLVILKRKTETCNEGTCPQATFDQLRKSELSWTPSNFFRHRTLIWVGKMKIIKIVFNNRWKTRHLPFIHQYHWESCKWSN